MYADEEGCGYDVPFTCEVPEYLKCIVCHFVLRDPVQIVKCGHQFCQQCFERIKNYSQHLSTQLCCPIDRDVIDLNEVFTDTSLSRMVGSLQVKCTSYEIGCSWIGDLRNLQKHEERCEHKVSKKLDGLFAQQNEDDPPLLKEFCRRLDTLEKKMLEKEKEIIHLKFNINEVRANYNMKAKDIITLKKKADQNEEEMRKVRDLNQQMKVEFEENVQLLMIKNQLLEGKVGILENQLLETDKISQCTKSGTLLNHEIVGVSINDEISGRMKIQNIHPAEQQCSSRAELTNKCHVEDLVKHIENIENILFCHQYPENNNVAFKWIMSDYQRLANTGVDIYSPVFYTNINGYCFQFKVSWKGDHNDLVGVYLYLHRKEDTKVLKPFNSQYKFEVVGGKGESKCANISLSSIDKERDDCFTIHRNENRSRYCFGPTALLKMPNDERYIINDILTVKCTVHY